MNLSQLETELAAIEAAAANLRTSVDRAKSDSDPLAAHIYRSRREYRQAVARSSKSGKRIRDCHEATYTAACRLGFEGTAKEWLGILRPGA